MIETMERFQVLRDIYQCVERIIAYPTREVGAISLNVIMMAVRESYVDPKLHVFLFHVFPKNPRVLEPVTTIYTYQQTSWKLERVSSGVLDNYLSVASSDVHRI